jgi:hypothetical protein
MREVTPEEVESFIRETHPAKEWRDSEALPDWVSWMMDHGCIDVFTEDGENVSVLICSRMSTANNATEDFDFDPEGNCLVIDLILSRRKHQKHLLGALGRHLIKKHGYPDSVHWKRMRASVPAHIPSYHLAYRLNLLPTC